MAARRLTDLLRSEQARRRREETVTEWELTPAEPVTDGDDSLVLLFLCCHRDLSPASQIALTLRAVGGLTTSEIARAFLVPEDTMTRRISRAKKTVAGDRFRVPVPEEQAERLAAVLHVLYLVFNEGYVATSGPSLHRVELAAEAIRLTRLVYGLLPDDSEVAGLLALMLLTDVRREARADFDGSVVPMAEQDRSLWDADAIAEGIAPVEGALPDGPAGPYQLQTAIAALHDEAASSQETDWPQIVEIYGLLLTLADNPVVRLNHAVAVAMARGPQEAMVLRDSIDGLEQDPRWHAVRAHLLEMAGDLDAARTCFLEAARRTSGLSQQRYLNEQAARLSG